MQNLLSAKIRFKEFTDPWQEKFGDKLFKTITEINQNYDLPILAISQEFGAIPRNLIDYKVIVSYKSISNYKVVRKGNFIISLRSFQGGIEYSKYDGICSPAYIILKPIQQIFDNFFKYYFKSHDYIQKLNSKLEGIRDGKMVSFKQFSEIKIPLPNLAEQQKIAEVLSACDDEINLLKDKLSNLKLQKQGLMQNLLTGKVRVRV
ncbi:TPA: restriction endonuclease subunit S [Campylobacter fetus]|nr:restriction endonuclease subunit S [Campylobacter fetus]